MENKIYVLSEEEVKSITSKFESVNQKLDQLISQKQSETAWIDNEEACAILKISPRSLQNLRDTKRISYSRPGGKTYYLRADIEKYLEANYNGKTDSND